MPKEINIVIKMPKVKDKETLKNSKRKAVSYLKVARWEGDVGEWVKR